MHSLSVVVHSHGRTSAIIVVQCADHKGLRQIETMLYLKEDLCGSNEVQLQFALGLPAM